MAQNTPVVHVASFTAHAQTNKHTHTLTLTLTHAAHTITGAQECDRVYVCVIVIYKYVKWHEQRYSTLVS